jgi:MFS family permease
MASEKRDRASSIVMAMMFSFALSSLGLVVPLAAIRAGYEPSLVGLLVAFAAVGQIGTRLFLGWLMRRVADKTLLITSAVLIALSCVLLMLSTTLIIFAASQLVQGAARALFWTCSQTHAVRASSTAVKGIRRMNLAAGVGFLIGPACAGLLFSVSDSLPLLVASIVGCVAIAPAALLNRFPVFAKKVPSRDRSNQIGRRPSVRAACGMSAAAGVWRGLLDSFIPVALSLAGQSAVVIGLLLSLTNIAMQAGSAVSIWIRERGLRTSFAIGMLFTGLGLAVTAPVATFALAAAVSLTISGLGAGILQTVGPAIAADDVGPEERGDVLALTGTYRAVALFLAPVGVAGMLTVMPLALSLILGGFFISAPAALLLRPPRK